MRVFEVAKELGVDHRKVLKKCDELRIDVRNYMSRVTPEDVARLREAFGKKAARRLKQKPGLPERDLLLFEIARTLELSVHQVLERCAELGMDQVSNQSSIVPARDVARLNKALGLRPSGSEAERKTGRDQPSPALPESQPATTEKPQAKDLGTFGDPLVDLRDYLGRHKRLSADAADAPDADAPDMHGRSDRARAGASAPRARTARPRKERQGGPLHLALRTRGLEYPIAYVRRFLCAALAARDVGALVLLAGTTGTGKTAISRSSADLLQDTAGRVIAVRPEWLQASDLLGYVNPLRRLFAPSAFVHALREASVSDDSLYLLLLDEMNLARIESYGADLLAILEQGGAARRLALYPPDQNQLWLEEKRALEALGEGKRSVADGMRLAELERFFEAAGGAPERAHRLAVPDSLVVLGTLNTDAHTAQLSPKVIDRSFVLQSTPPELDELFAPPPKVEDSAPEKVELPERREPAAWDALPFVRDHFRKLLAMLAPFGVVPTRRMARNAAAYLGYARHEGASDADLLADLIHLLILPRIVLPIEPAERLLDILQPWISKNAPALDPEIAALRRQVDDGRHGDVRGLR